MDFLKWLFLCFLNFNSVFALNDFSTPEYKLYNKLLTNYSKTTRPVTNWSEIIDVYLSLKLRKIANVAESQQTILVYVDLEMRWKDVNFVWEPKDYGDIDSIVLPADKVWIPDMHLFNSAAEDDRIYPVNVEINSNGTVYSFPINQLYAHCDFDFTDFPFDIQTCDFMIGNVVDRNKIKIWLQSSADEWKILNNLEWKFVAFKDKPEFELNVPGTLDSNDYFSADWSVAMTSLKIKRQSAFYVNLFIWPLVFVLFIGMSVFILPPTCVERASMGVLLLLTLVIMSLMLDTYTPKNTTSISVIGRLIGFSMFMVTWSTFVSTLIISIDKDSFTYRIIPTWLRNLMLNYIGKITCKHETIQKILTANPLNREEEIEILDTNQLLNQNKNESNLAQTSSNLVSTENLDINQAKTLLVLINNQLAMLRMRIQEKDSKDQNKKDWYVIACCLDRFCLYVYVLIMTLGLFILFV